MKRSGVFFALAGLALGVAVSVRRARAAKDNALRFLDDDFHAAYGCLRALGARAAPVLVLFGDSLVLFHAERRAQFAVTAAASQVLKAAAHVPVGIYVALQESAASEAPFDVGTNQRLSAMRDAQAKAQDGLEALDASMRPDVASVLEKSQGILEHVLSRGHASAPELSSFGAELGPLLLRLTEHATRLELASLHAATEAALSELDAKQREQLEVVIAGAHQARARSLALQYFQKRFGEAPDEERRVVYAEAASDASQARELIGTRRLDRSIALAFFGDAKRLQRDVLGDAAARLLERSELAPIR